MAALTRESQKIFMAAVITSDAGETLMQVAAVEVTVDHFFDIRPPETVIPGKPVIINLHDGFKVILHAGIIVGVLRPPGAVFLRR